MSSSLLDRIAQADRSAYPWMRPQRRASAAVERVPEPTAVEPAGDAPAARDEATVQEQARAGSQVKALVHRRLLERINLSKLDAAGSDAVGAEIRKVAGEVIAKESLLLNAEERDELIGQVMDEIFGLGPLEPLLKDATVSDILVNTASRVWVERNGKLEMTDIRFRDDQHLRQVIDRVVSAVGRRIDEASPMVDARLADGSRVNAIIPPLALDGPHLSIRKFKKDVLSAEHLVEKGAMTAAMLAVLRGVSVGRLNVLISGGTGAGKTTLLNVLSSFIPHDERIITIEDSAELQLRQPHVVRLETRPSNIEGAGEITQRQLVINALRMRPERIILGEVRGAEAIDMLQAMNTGHDGSMATLHANTPRDALGRLETLISMSGLGLPERAVRQQITSAVHVVIQANRLSDGSRKITAISELTGLEGEVVTMQDIFVFERQGVDPRTGKVIGRFRATGIRPRFAEHLQARGVELSADLFKE